MPTLNPSARLERKRDPNRKRVTAPLSHETYVALLVIKLMRGVSIEQLVSDACDAFVRRSKEGEGSQ